MKMKSLLSALALYLASLTAWNQCNIVATGFTTPVTCNGDCDGSIVDVLGGVVVDDDAGSCMLVGGFIEKPILKLPPPDAGC